jgi:hypothetical protein
MKTPGATCFMLRRAIASLAASEAARAACDPVISSANPLTNTIVTCTGTTTNQNGTTGYGVPEDAGNTINVQSGASVTGTNTGIRLSGTIGTSSSPVVTETVNNFGAISGGGQRHPR